MKLFAKRTAVPVAPAAEPEVLGGLFAAPLGGTDLQGGRRAVPATPPAYRFGPVASNPTGADVFSAITEDWGRRQTLLGYADRLRCEHADESGWEFHRGASFDSDMSTGSRRLNEDDTTLQITALHRPCANAVVWSELKAAHHDIRHEDFEGLGEARFTGLDTTGAPVCVFRAHTLAVRIRMTGTLAQRQYTRVYALDVFQRLDQRALAAWIDATVNLH